MSLRSRWVVIHILHSYCLSVCLLYYILRVLKSPVIIVNLSTSPFSSISFCFIYFKALWLNIYTFITIMSSWMVTLLIFLQYTWLSVIILLFWNLLFNIATCDSAGKESIHNAGDLGSIPELGRSAGEGKGCPLQYSHLENSMDGIVQGVAKSQNDWMTFTLFLFTFTPTFLWFIFTWHIFFNSIIFNLLMSL